MNFTKDDIGKTFVRDDGVDVVLVYVSDGGECVFESRSKRLLTLTYASGAVIKSALGVKPKQLKAFAVVVEGDIYSFGRERASCEAHARVLGGSVVELEVKK